MAAPMIDSSLVRPAWANVHAVAQVPQCVGSLARVTSQPLALLPSQSSKPVAHAPRTHAPVAQLEAALANAHARPQAPQFVAVFVGASQPSAGSPLQS